MTTAKHPRTMMSPTAKNGTQDRVEYNGFSDGKTLRQNEKTCRPENEDLVRGLVTEIPACLLEGDVTIRDLFPKFDEMLAAGRVKIV